MENKRRPGGGWNDALGKNAHTTYAAMNLTWATLVAAAHTAETATTGEETITRQTEQVADVKDQTSHKPVASLLSNPVSVSTSERPANKCYRLANIVRQSSSGKSHLANPSLYDSWFASGNTSKVVGVRHNT